MGTWHRDQYNFVIIPFGIGMIGIFRMFAQRKQVTVGQDRTLGIAGGAGGIKLKNCIVGTCWFEHCTLLPGDHRARFGFADDSLDVG